ncbi:hypothetical protein CLW00_10722 [Mongoliibacter ruber]|uniref:Uncharacterized protein n=1 Tax=Mongoliibacter ruber TaxID=1750599 RepID=A0A2T0WKC0_9BACT|nr:hypothetical protein CLW00_10722 [Mongoliibacter ruber]
MRTGHTIDQSVCLQKETLKVLGNPANMDWLIQPLQACVQSKNEGQVSLNREKRKSSDKVILLNCLDDCFGHVFTKLWNACFIPEGYDLIVVIPQQCAWMVPQEVAEIWAVPVTVSQIGKGLGKFDDQIKRALEDFSEVLLHPGYVHLDHLKVPLEKVLKLKRFSLPDFLVKTPRIGIVLREDRFWLNSRFLEFLFLVCKKTGTLEKYKFIFLRRQRRLVLQLNQVLEKHFPDLEFYVSGLGTSGDYPAYIQDLRVDEIISENELSRNQIYAETQLVIGVHGSHLLVPTGLAAGYVNINPRYKTAHWVEDTILPYTGRMQHFLGRKLDQFSSPQLVAHHIIRIFDDFEYVQKRLNE